MKGIRKKLCLILDMLSSQDIPGLNHAHGHAALIAYPNPKVLFYFLTLHLKIPFPFTAFFSFMITFQLKLYFKFHLPLNGLKAPFSDNRKAGKIASPPTSRAASRAFSRPTFGNGADRA